MMKRQLSAQQLWSELGQQIELLQAENLQQCQALIAARGDWNVVASALSTCLTQMHRMKGLFVDPDGQIAEAISGAERALTTTPSQYTSAPSQPPALENLS